MFARLATTALLLLPSAHAFWIVGHPHPVVRDRLDPIVDNGTVSKHVHSVGGSTAFAPTLSSAALKQGNCTTGSVQADMSQYWVPQMYHRNSNDSYTAIPVSFMNVYYLPRGGPNTAMSAVSAFPDDLRMLAGDPKRTTYNATDFENTAISYVCLDYSKSTVQPPMPNFPTDNCPDGVRAQAVFPSCWDGVNLDSADHKSHMSYPVQAVDSGDCPASHPKKLVTIFYEWVFNIAQFDGRGDNVWVFANGGGANSFHADFYMGWDRKVLQDAIDQCGDRSDIFNDVEKCAPLAPSVDRTKSDACYKAPMVDEETAGPLAALPGCNQDQLTKAATKCSGAVPAIIGYSPASAGSPSSSSSSSAVSAPSASSAPAVSYSSAAASSSSPASSSVASSSAAAVTSAITSVPGGQLAVSTKIPTATAIATAMPAPTKVCKRAAHDSAADKHKRAVKNHVRRSLNRLSPAH